MEKTIKIGKQSIRLDNNISWMMIYRDQFGSDIVPVMMPMLAALADLISPVLRNAEDDGQFDLRKVLSGIDGDSITDAFIHLGTAQMVDLINVVWAMAKAADDSIPDPKTWARSLDAFPMDVVFPEVLGLISEGVISSKNLKRLKGLKRNLQPKSNSTQSSSPESSEA